MLPICFPYAAHMFRSAHFQCENDHLPICVSHMLKLGPYVDLFFAICYHMLDNIWATYNLVVFENTLHMGHIWAAYGPHMGCPYAAHMWPICFGRSSGYCQASIQIQWHYGIFHRPVMRWSYTTKGPTTKRQYGAIHWRRTPSCLHLWAVVGGWGEDGMLQMQWM